MSENQDVPLRVELNETARVEAFSDGVFAIAITLLILEIPVPHELPQGVTLWDYVLGQWTLFAAFFAGFATIGIMWINHHRIFNLIRHGDSWLNILNLLLLLGITFINYPTALVGSFLGKPEAQTAMAIYAATTVGIAIAYNLLWRHAVRAKLLGVEVDPRVIRTINRGYLLGPTLYTVAFVFAFINVYVSLAIVIGLALFFALPQRNPLTNRLE
jgi:uncharacterized membrane protein